MRFSPENKTWEIVDMSNLTLAFYNETSEFPFGSRPWYFLDQNCTDPGKPWRTINLQEVTDQPGLASEIFGKYHLMQINICCQETSVVTTAPVSIPDMCVTMPSTVRITLTRPTAAW